MAIHDSTKIVRNILSAIDKKLDSFKIYIINALRDYRIGPDQIQMGAITTIKINNAAITNAKIGNAEIDTAKIQDAAITNAKIGNAAIDTANIKDAAIDSAKIENAAITNAKIKDAAITNAKIADLSVDTAKISDLAVTTAKIAQASITNAKIENAAIDTAKIALGAITSALIENGAIGNVQIADASITDAKIVELSANRITAGVLSVERLIIRGDEQSLIYAVNNMGELISTQVDTIDGYVLTERTITADKIVAHSLTANEIAAHSITANEILAGTITGAEIKGETITGAHIKAGEITTSHVSSNFGETLNLSSNESINMTVNNTVTEAIGDISSGSVNLTFEEESQAMTAVGNNNLYWAAADGLEHSSSYIVSVQNLKKNDGVASGATWELVRASDGFVKHTGVFEFKDSRQGALFDVPEIVNAENPENWVLRLYCGIKGSTSGVSVTYNQIRVVRQLDKGLDAFIQGLIAEMNLEGQFVDSQQFIEWAGDIEQQTSVVSQSSSDWTLAFNNTKLHDGVLSKYQSRIELGDDGSPYIKMSSDNSGIEMRLTNDKLGFYMSNEATTPMAYFSNSKLYVTQIEAVDQLSIGTSSNGFLDIVTTDTGVGFKWRT